jgi:hypothetical protein
MQILLCVLISSKVECAFPLKIREAISQMGVFGLASWGERPGEAERSLHVSTVFPNVKVLYFGIMCLSPFKTSSPEGKEANMYLNASFII